MAQQLYGVTAVMPRDCCSQNTVLAFHNYTPLVSSIQGTWMCSDNIWNADQLTPLNKDHNKYKLMQFKADHPPAPSHAKVNKLTLSAEHQYN